MTRLFEALICVPIDVRIGRQAGEFLREFRKSHNVEIADALIASSGIIAQAQLWTRNRKHYPNEGAVVLLVPRIPGGMGTARSISRGVLPANFWKSAMRCDWSV